jgi:chemotaxis protein methyltransferase CheR
VYPVNDADVEILLNDLLDKYGFDFTGYSRASLKRRINRIFSLDKHTSIAEFRYRILNNTNYASKLIEEITVNVTEMFRDPEFYTALRKQVLPVLATYPVIRIWHAGCSSGEEVYSMAIVLHEAGLLHKSILYGTDLNAGVLDLAKKGMFPLSEMKQYSLNYIDAGGKEEFSHYYTIAHGKAKFDAMLREKMVFSTHNLVSDRSFNEFQLILCRNVLIYFDQQLQKKVFELFYNSLEPLGFLALGSKETLRYSGVAKDFEEVDGKRKIWRRMH